ncbi:hypothetical protein PQC57_gp001 [Escherichia phage vB_EcoP_WFI101126]|uniref:Uncharacterized protein n=1 Tax=Escherichia phage vB_EcoP_WFI101126 TaxID=2508203 RepID=A0A482MS99_9CAUD|nr:hypothetical protein PQC57_gp001 [Escherichia phage vB_EcoP_WFI101126]QBQ76429.1 hypothetical protein WFI101126_00001 [Escherichia phage vB_EcoP_WFI101126]
MITSTIGYAKLTGMKEFTPFISPLGDVVNVASLNTAHGWTGLNGMDILVSNSFLFIHLLLYSEMYQV